MIPHPIAVDNYFVDRELTPRDADGNYDFECLEAIDVEPVSYTHLDVYKRQTENLHGSILAQADLSKQLDRKEYKKRLKKLQKKMERLHGELYLSLIHISW